jgi:hypothetical protein
VVEAKNKLTYKDLENTIKKNKIDNIKSKDLLQLIKK